MKSLLLALVFVIPFSAFPQITCRLTGSITGISDKQIIYLADSENKILDSTSTESGKFAFRRKLEEPVLLKLKLKNTSPRNINVFVEDGDVQIQAEYIPAESKLVNIKISGSDEHTLYQRLLDAEEGGLTPEEMGLMKKYMQEKDTTAMRVLKEKKRLQMDESFTRIFNIAKENPDKYAVAYFIGSARITGAEQWLKDRLYKIYSVLANSVKQSVYGKKFLVNYSKGK